MLSYDKKVIEFVDSINAKLSRAPKNCFTPLVNVRKELEVPKNDFYTFIIPSLINNGKIYFGGCLQSSENNKVRKIVNNYISKISVLPCIEYYISFNDVSLGVQTFPKVTDKSKWKYGKYDSNIKENKNTVVCFPRVDNNGNLLDKNLEKLITEKISDCYF